MALTFRSFCYSPSGELLRVSQKLAQELYMSIDDAPQVKEFAGHSINFAMIFFEVSDRRAREIVRTEYYVLRFDRSGKVDHERLRSQTVAHLHRGSFGRGGEDQGGKVVDRADDFVARGGMWKPTGAQRMQLTKAITANTKLRYIRP